MKAHLAQRRHPFDRLLEGVELSGADWTSDGPQDLVDSHPGSGFNLRVLDPEVHWTYSSPAKLTKMYGSVQLLEDCALGQWCCIDRETGLLRWEAHDLEPDSVIAVSEGVIVATATSSRGSMTGTFGGWGISLATGEVLWTTSVGVSLLTLLWMLMRGRSDELSANPLGVRAGECALENGRILDIHSGEVLRSVRDPSAWIQKGKVVKAPGDDMWKTGRALLPGGDVLHLGWPKVPTEEALSVRRLSSSGAERWRFESKDHAGGFSNGFHQFRLRGDYAYLIVKGQPERARNDWSLWVLDARDGQIVQRLELSQDNAEEHRIEDVDLRHLIWSRGGRHLSAHSIRGAQENPRQGG